MPFHNDTIIYRLRNWPQSPVRWSDLGPMFLNPVPVSVWFQGFNARCLTVQILELLQRHKTPEVKYAKILRRWQWVKRQNVLIPYGEKRIKGAWREAQGTHPNLRRRPKCVPSDQSSYSYSPSSSWIAGLCVQVLALNASWIKRCFGRNRVEALF